MNPLPVVEVSQRAAKRVREGHVWIFRNELRGNTQAEPGDIVQVSVTHGSGGKNSLGTAFYNPISLISLRMFSRRVIVPNRSLWEERINLAYRLRELSNRLENTNAMRLVYAEADQIPGLIVDRFDDVLVMQTLCLGVERLKDLLVEILSDISRPRAIIERNDAASRKLEGLDERVGVLKGKLDGSVEVYEGEIRFLVDPLSGQKTGYYLDQRQNRMLTSSYATGRCLDVFSYQGGFGLQLKKAGAEDVTLVDQSEAALELAKVAARLNRLEINTIHANAFDLLKEQQAAQEVYDVIVLDPPAFAKNRAAVERASRGYKEINLRAMQLLKPGGVLITSSCSYHMHADRFEAVLLDAARDAKRVVQVLERRGQASDHPERLGFPESRYLKCFFLRVL